MMNSSQPSDSETWRDTETQSETVGSLKVSQREKRIARKRPARYETRPHVTCILSVCLSVCPSVSLSVVRTVSDRTWETRRSS